jgi:phosphopantothenoylcysteine synthetase/decarboxylase
MKVIVTCGPSYEPIDEVRRLTNFSTGELGVLLAQALAQSGHSIVCLKGSGATFPGPSAPCNVRRFDTNDDLLALFHELASGEVGAVFQVAALCDYKIRRVMDEAGQDCSSPKIASRSGRVSLELEPATKVLPKLRAMFPAAILVGWKYELAGTRDEALSRAQRQISEAGVDACIVNGRAFGPGFGLVEEGRLACEFEDKARLVGGLVEWLKSHTTSRQRK